MPNTKIAEKTPHAIAELGDAAAADILAGLQINLDDVREMEMDLDLHSAFQDALREDDEADYDQLHHARAAFLAGLTAEQCAAYESYSRVWWGHEMWQRRSAYAIGVAIGKRLAGGAR